MNNPSNETLSQDQQKELTHLLVTGVVHDFNNLLTTILANTSLARQSTHPQTALYTQLFRAEKAANKAKNLAANLLECAKGGGQDWSFVNMGKMAIDMAELALSGSPIALETKDLDGLWPVRAQKGPLGQVLLNLFVNAVQAMADGGTITLIGKNASTENGQEVQLTIQDEGVGIPEENLIKIFEAHFTTKEMGSGIGLAASKAILESIGGTIGVKSMVGKGTSFVICMPATLDAVPEVEEEEGSVIQLYKGQGKLLLLEDDELILKTMSDMLIYLGYEVETATRGEEAVEAFTSYVQSDEPFDAVVMDLTLPHGMPASEAVLAMREASPEVKLIFTSGYSKQDLSRKNNLDGFAAYIQKPYTIEVLSKVLNAVLKKDK